ncbi:hypothetical protein [Actinoplanes teichomyceticus]|uniref:Calcium-binding protein n=1 Tax=Actinoplanes teichomyceticus TaxID=1867 RepID=A0A561WSF0_ACTTI|nr:hypothetical protein [Actinoplanes teichomyceticus]TWG26764.1 hypothetical protein FHX34_1011762 [Actinoplanes teichomyceticus]GIF15162.1 hypothetical protein Ate01nite_51940 [Actinoplanes teichomyceticus]
MRKSLVRRGGSALLATLAAMTTVGLAASPARADISVAAVGLSTTAVVLDGDAGCGNRTRVTVKVYDPRPSEDEIFGVNAHVVAPDGDDADFLLMKYSSRSGNYAYYTDNVFLCGFHDPGTYRVRVEVTWWDQSVADSRVAERAATFAVRRPTALTYNATPEPVRKGSKLTHTGRLTFDPYGYGAKYGAKGVAIRFYFRATGTKSYVYQGQTVTGKNGTYTRKLTATKSGTWKAVYPGSSTRQAQVRYDAVKVKS